MMPPPEALRSARIGEFVVTDEDIVFADEDGVLFVPGHRSEQLLSAAHAISGTERRQAEAIKSGVTLHDQLKFDQYLAHRTADPSLTFRKHLRAIGGAIEE